MRVPDSGGLREIIEAALRRIENVLRERVGGRLIEGGRHVAAEERVALADLVVHATENLVCVVLSDRTERHLSAGIGGLGQEFDDIESLLAESRDGDLLVRKCSAVRVPYGGGKSGAAAEIAGKHLRRRNEGCAVHRIRAEARALVSD